MRSQVQKIHKLHLVRDQHRHEEKERKGRVNTIASINTRQASNVDHYSMRKYLELFDLLLGLEEGSCIIPYG